MVYITIMSILWLFLCWFPLTKPYCIPLFWFFYIFQIFLPKNVIKNEDKVERFNLNVTNSTYAKIEGYLTLSDGSKLPFVLEGYLNEDNNVCGGRNFGNNPNFFGRGFDIEFGEIKIVENKVYILSNLTQKYYVSGNKAQTVYKGELTKYIKDYDYKFDENT